MFYVLKYLFCHIQFTVIFVWRLPHLCVKEHCFLPICTLTLHIRSLVETSVVESTEASIVWSTEPIETSIETTIETSIGTPVETSIVSIVHSPTAAIVEASEEFSMAHPSPDLLLLCVLHDLLHLWKKKTHIIQKKYASREENLDLCNGRSECQVPDQQDRGSDLPSWRERSFH